MAAEECCIKDLPDECWELIFNRLLQSHLHHHHPHLEPPSLACKRFLSITNRLRTHLTIPTTPTTVFSPLLPKLLDRFPLLSSIDLNASSRNDADLHRLIIDIAKSNLTLESLDLSGAHRLPLDGLKLLGPKMKYLKVLNCCGLRILRDVELVVIAESMPLLEDLDICYPVNDLCGWNPELPARRNAGEVGVTDTGIEVLSSKLKGLRKIDVSGNEFLTDKSILALSTNCVYLAEIAVLNCSLVTRYGIEFLMQNSPNLSSLSVHGMEFGTRLDDYYSSVCCARNLYTLDMYDSVITDEFLHVLAKAGLPLKRFTLALCTHSSFTFSGISVFFNQYQSLEYLSFAGIDFLTDEKMSDLSHFLAGVVTIRLEFCSKLTESTLIMLAKNCPLLQVIYMVGTNLGGAGDRASEIVKKPLISFLNLANNPNLSDECLAKIALACPSLEVLDVSLCKGITEKGIANFLNSGSKIRDLQIRECGGIESIGTGFELSKLEVLSAARSGINDEGLVVIGNRCGGLLNLNLEGCLGVTTLGLKEILTNCKRLREINLNRCVNMSSGTADWMVFSRPSLRKLILPYSALPSESQRKLLLRHGCLVLPETGGWGHIS